MNRVVSKYGLAAHLAFLAVAPLFLFPFCSEAATAKAVLWLSLVAAVWCLLSPSVRGGEPLHVARRRVLSKILVDPLFWVSALLALVAGVAALNGGVKMAYDAEAAVWRLTTPFVEILPGCVSGRGFLPFAVSVAAVVVLVGARQALGRSARMAFLFVASAGAGLAAVVALVAANEGSLACRSLLAVSATKASCYGFAMGLWFLGGIAALVTAFERRWNRAMPVFVLSVGGTALGVFAFAPPALSLLFAAGAVLLLPLAFAYLFVNVGRSSEFRFLAVLAILLAVAALAGAFLLPQALTAARFDAFMTGDFLPERMFALRRTLSEIALRAWKESPWIGTGLGSFGLDVRFQALPEDWAVLPRGIAAIPNGGWWLLAERGIAGAAFVALPFGFVLFTFGRRLVAWATQRLVVPHPACLLLPLALAALAASAPFDGSFLRPDAMLAAIAVVAVAPKCFPKPEKR